MFFISLIMECIITTSFSISINGSSSPSFTLGAVFDKGTLCPLSHPFSVWTTYPYSLTLKYLTRPGVLLNFLKMVHLYHIYYLQMIYSYLPKETWCLFTLLTLFLTHFSLVFDQSINLQKSNVIFSNNAPTIVKVSCLQQLHLSESHFLGKYLGFYYSQCTPKPRHFKFLLDKLKARLLSWHHKFLSLLGRVILLKSTLASMPIHHMQVCLLSPSTLITIDKISRYFFMGRC